MSNVPVRTLGAVKEHAASRSDSFCEAHKAKSVILMELALLTPKGATAKEVFSHLTPAMRSTYSSEGSWAATWSLVLRVEKGFAKQKAEGKHTKFSDAVAFVSAKGSNEKALKALFPPSSEPKAPADPSVGGEAKGEGSKAKVVEGTVEVSKADLSFAEVCQTIKEWSVSDLTALTAFIQDNIAKRNIGVAPAVV